MTRAFPVSLFLHLVVLSLIIWFGSHVARQTIPRHRTISVRVAPLTRTPPAQAEPEPAPVIEEPAPVVEETRPEPVVQEPPREEPAVVPEARPQETVVEEAPPEEETPPVRAEPEPEAAVEDAPPAETAPAPAPGSKVGTDVAIPAHFQYWIDLLEQRVAMNWHPKQLGFRRSTRVCRVHFHVEKNGMITRETIVESSGVPLMDRESLKAVKALGRFLPIPNGLADNALGVTYTFTLTAGN